VGHQILLESKTFCIFSYVLFSTTFTVSVTCPSGALCVSLPVTP